jgi:hypothetical protein
MHNICECNLNFLTNLQATSLDYLSLSCKMSISWTLNIDELEQYQANQYIYDSCDSMSSLDGVICYGEFNN